MEFEINTEFAALDGTALAEYLAAARAEFNTLVAADTPTAEIVEAATALAAHIDEVVAEQDTREQAEADLADQFAALQNRFADESAEDAEDEGGDEDDEDDDADDDAEEEAEVTAAVKPKKTVASLAKKVSRPPVPARKPVTITASANVDGFATGTALEGMEQVGQAVVAKMRGFAPPTGDGKSENLQKYGVAQFHLDFPEELTIDRHSDDMEVLSYAANETRLVSEKGEKSLTAAGGWCAPSETIYDMCAGETLDGILSLPEVNVARGGIKFTKGPSFADFYTNVGFLQTEAQAIAGDTKTCYEVPCGTFTDVRLDAIGICLKAPILTNAAYPELVNRWISGSMVAHQHKVNASVIGRIVTAVGAARVFTGLGSTVGDTLSALELVADQRRQTYRLGINSTMEVVVPFWAKGIYRADLGLRTGVGAEAITDSILAAHFAARNLNVQYVYDWQNLVLTDEAYPATYQALVYPAGAFVKGTSDVINLSAVYDAASLAVNTYTAVFFEQGLLVANMCWGGDLLTLPICNAGRTGIADLTCA